MKERLSARMTNQLTPSERTQTALQIIEEARADQRITAKMQRCSGGGHRIQLVLRGGQRKVLIPTSIEEWQAVKACWEDL